jgi:hypothetical protein
VLRRTVTKSELEQATNELLREDCLDEVLAIYDTGPWVWRLRRFRDSLPDVFDQYRRYRRVLGAIIATKRELQSIVVNGTEKTAGLHLPSQNLVKKGGISVAFIGADGSGKSTVSTEVCAELGRFTDVEQIYFEHGESGQSVLQLPKQF